MHVNILASIYTIYYSNSVICVIFNTCEGDEMLERFKLFKEKDPTKPSLRGSEVYVHSGLWDPWGALEGDGIDDPDEVRYLVEIIEAYNAVDDTTPEGAIERERLANEFTRAVELGHAAVLESNTDTASELRNSEDHTDTSNA